MAWRGRRTRVGRLDKTQKIKNGRSAFTLIEIMIVLAIVGLLAGMVVPRIFRYREPPAVRLQRTVEEASNYALSGVSIRLKLEPVESGGHGSVRRGRIAAEVLARAEDPAVPGREKLAWSPVRLTYPPEGEGWRLDPEIVYFYTDGSCTPARISWTQPGAPDSDAETFLLTVTGYLFEQERRR